MPEPANQTPTEIEPDQTPENGESENYVDLEPEVQKLVILTAEEVMTLLSESGLDDEVSKIFKEEVLANTTNGYSRNDKASRFMNGGLLAKDEFDSNYQQNVKKLYEICKKYGVTEAKDKSNSEAKNKSNSELIIEALTEYLPKSAQD